MQAEGWGISTNDMKSALDSLKTLEGLPDCNVQCQEMVKDSISKLEPALEKRITNHSSKTENFKELTGILATVIVMNENGLIDGRATISGGGKGGAKGTVTEHSKTNNKLTENLQVNKIDEASVTNYFKQDRKYWSADPLDFKGNKVYQ
ncbi:hypothetical protein [Providencia vermicola]|uniref:hypothetical protein n=1 Tax=Providencia vermicola TaxID=333965 RepID=UPI0034D7329D